MFLFFQNSANDNDGVDNNTSNEDRICHGTDDSESSSESEADISEIKVLCSHKHNTGLFVVVGSLEFAVVCFVDVGELALVASELMVVVAAVYMLFQE